MRQPHYDDAAYQLAYRKLNTDYARRNRLLTSARKRAQTKLAGEYPERFAALLALELEHIELPPVRIEGTPIIRRGLSYIKGGQS